MIHTIITPLSGMIGGLAQFNASATNIANSLTSGYQSQRVNLSSRSDQGVNFDTGIVSQFSNAPIIQTGLPMDVAIDGVGFFEVELPGGTAYTRNGNFRMDSERFLVNASGARLIPNVQIPVEVSSVSITADGQIRGIINGQETLLGQLSSVQFANPSGLEPLGDGLFAQTSESGIPIRGTFAQTGFGRLIQGGLNASSTDLVSDIGTLLISEKMIIGNIRVIQTLDELSQESVNLIRPRKTISE